MFRCRPHKATGSEMRVALSFVAFLEFGWTMRQAEAKSALNSGQMYTSMPTWNMVAVRC